MMDQGALDASIQEAVRRFYERHPYPRYPLFATPRWQDGYLSSSLFVNALSRDHGLSATALQRSLLAGSTPNILLIGGGEIQPYVLRKWEPAQHHLQCVDLSPVSIRRARLRNYFYGQSLSIDCVSIEEFIHHAVERGHTFEHVDIYGVLHHLAAPSAVMKNLSLIMKPQSTLRIMVYNESVRTFLLQCSKAFQLLKLDPLRRHDLHIARRICLWLAEASPRFKTRLSQMGEPFFQNDARFADAFMHPRVVRFDLSKWLALFQDNGWRLFGLFDRYGELDDLPNPLWTPPSEQDLTSRIADQRFENNFECFLQYQPGKCFDPKASISTMTRALSKRHAFSALKAPPKLWFSFNETRDLPLGARLKLWQAFLRFQWNARTAGLNDLLLGLPPATVGRLARLGVIFRSQLCHPSLEDHALAPLCDSMDPPDYGHFQGRFSADSLRDLAKLIPELSEARFDQVVRRLLAAAQG